MNDAQRQAVDFEQLRPITQEIAKKEHKYFEFYGSESEIQKLITDMPQNQIETMIDANITITQNLFEAGCYQECYYLTIISGCCLIFPIFFMFCKWWRRIVSDAYAVSESTYQSLKRVLNAPRLRNMTLRIKDNLFDRNKARVICEMVMQSRLIGFTLYNSASQYDYNGEYGDFAENLKQLKNKPGLMIEARWGSQFLA